MQGVGNMYVSLVGETETVVREDGDGADNDVEDKKCDVHEVWF